jgi:hypothetical protein
MRGTFFVYNILIAFLSFHLPFAAEIMPKPNPTESTTTNFNDAGLVNSSNTNLSSRMVDPAAENTRTVQIDDECDVIGDLIGHYGKWQFVMTILLSLFQVPNTFHIFSPTFQVRIFMNVLSDSFYCCGFCLFVC